MNATAPALDIHTEVHDHAHHAHHAPLAQAELDKLAQAKAVVRRSVYWSSGTGLIPLPMLDILAIFGLQVKMVCDLAKVYGLEASPFKVKGVVGALVGSMGTGQAFAPGVASLMKLIPGVGVLSFAALSVVAAASTYALGRVFTAHFAGGGTLLDFDVAKNKEAYLKLFAAEQKAAEQKAAQQKAAEQKAAAEKAAELAVAK